MKAAKAEETAVVISVCSADWTVVIGVEVVGSMAWKVEVEDRTKALLIKRPVGWSYVCPFGAVIVVVKLCLKLRDVTKKRLLLMS